MRALFLILLSGCGSATSNPDLALPDDLASPPDLTTGGSDLSTQADLFTQPDLGGARDLFVDSSVGVDTNPGTLAAPFKTIGAAAMRANAGDTVKLLPGTWDAASEPGFASSGVTIPAGVFVKAVTPGTAILAGVLIFAGDGALDDVIFQGGTPGVSASAGSIALRDLRFLSENVAGSLKLSGTASVTLVPAGAADYGTVNAFARLSGTATLTVTGGKLGAVAWAGSDACPAFFKTADGSTLTLDGVTLDGNAIGAVAASATSQIFLENGTLIRNSSRSTAIGGVCSGAVLLGGSAGLDAQATQIVMNSGPGIRISGTSSVVKVTGVSAISNNDVGIWAPTNFRPASLTVANTEIIGNANGGIKLDSGTLALDVRGCTISGNLVNQGIMDYYDGAGSPTIFMRGTTLSNNGTNGIRIAGTNTGSYDFGTVADPGNNTLTGAGGGNTQGYFAVAGMTLINAIGNTWTAGNGTLPNPDAAGHYIPTSGSYVELSASNSPNFTLEQFGGGACYIRL